MPKWIKNNVGWIVKGGIAILVMLLTYSFAWGITKGRLDTKISAIENNQTQTRMWVKEHSKTCSDIEKSLTQIQTLQKTIREDICEIKADLRDIRRIREKQIAKGTE